MKMILEAKLNGISLRQAMVNHHVMELVEQQYVLQHTQAVSSLRKHKYCHHLFTFCDENL